MTPLTVEEARRAAMVALYDRTHGPAPDCYAARSEWWRLAAEESTNPDEQLQWASNQARLADGGLTR